MAITTTARYTARLDVPVSGDPAARVDILVDANGRTMGFIATSETSEQDAKRKIRDFLRDAKAAADA